jgi:hypothetical protein
MSFSLRDCIQGFIGNRTLTDMDLAAQLEHCLRLYRDALQARRIAFDSIQRGDTEEYHPDDEMDRPPPDQMIGGKKSRRHRKSRRNRRKSHKRK